MFSVEWDRVADLPTGQASYEGAASLAKLRADCKTTKVLHKGETIPGTRTILQADNFGIHFRDLYKHLNHLVAYLLEHKPPLSLAENYPNPFDGQTTAQILAHARATNKPNAPKKTEVETKLISSTVSSSWLKKFFGFDA